MGKQVVVCKTADLPPGARKVIKVGARSIGVFNVGGAYYAMLNVCPHQGANVCEGPICGTNKAVDDYRYEYVAEGELVRCARHGWEFWIKDGTCYDDPTVRAKTYPASARGDEVVVEV